MQFTEIRHKFMIPGGFSELCLGQKYFLVMKMKTNKIYLNPQFALFCNMVGLIQECFHVFPLFLTETPLHLKSDCTQFVILF